MASDQDPAIVADAAQILGRRRSHSAVDTLIRLTRQGDDNVAVAAIEALGRIGGLAAVEALIESVGSANFFRVFPAIDVLGRSGDPRAVEPLKLLLNNPSFLPEAARALGRTGEKSAIQPLTDLLKSSSDATVRVGLSRVDRFARAFFEEKLGQDAVAVDKQIQLQTGSETIRRLTRLLSNSVGVEAVVICKLFGMMGNVEAIPPLTGALDGMPLVRCQCRRSSQADRQRSGRAVAARTSQWQQCTSQGPLAGRASIQCRSGCRQVFDGSGPRSSCLGLRDTGETRGTPQLWPKFFRFWKTATLVSRLAATGGDSGTRFA